MVVSLHAKYPSMERQDLTQGQLGAFKFTPVDDTTCQSPSWYQHHLQPLFNQHYDTSRHVQVGDYGTSPDAIVTDPSIFSQRVKSSPNSSRLQPDPMALRAAVESATISPSNKFGTLGESQMRANVPTRSPQLQDKLTKHATQSMYTSESNSLPVTDTSLTAFSGTTSSLIRALEAEQEAHEATKIKLEQQYARTRDTEFEVHKLVERNKALLNSIRLLQSTVKHMVGKENQQSTTHETLVSSPEPSLLEKDCGNMALLNESAALPETSYQGQRSFSDSTDSEHQLQESNVSNTAVPTTCSGRTTHTGLVMASALARTKFAYPEAFAAAMSAGEQKHVNIQRCQIDSRATYHPGQVNHADHPVGQKFSKLSLLEPGKLLNSGNPKLVSASSHVSELSKVIDTPRKGTRTALEIGSPGQKQISQRAKSAHVTFMADSPVLNWKLNHDIVLKLQKETLQSNSNSYFIDHPIRYIPAVSESNIYRTVMMDFVPRGTPYCDVLDQIRGGQLESIQLYGPIGLVTDFVTARIVFTHEKGASNLYKRGQDPGIYISGQQVRVWQVLEPTYPRSNELQEAIYINEHTRILLVNSTVTNVEQLLKQKLRVQIEAGFILDIGRSYDGIPMIEFTSIEEATKALERFLDDEDLAGADFDFEDDPCSARYM